MQQTSALISLRYVTRITAVIILVAVVVGFFLPADYRIERSMTVSQSESSGVKEQIYTAQKWPAWIYIENGHLVPTQSTQLEGTNFVIHYNDDPAKVGRIEVSHVSSSAVLFSVTPNVKSKPIPNQIKLVTLPDGRLTVTWVIEGELEAGLLSPYLAMLANTIAGSNIETSLANLRH